MTTAPSVHWSTMMRVDALHRPRIIAAWLILALQVIDLTLTYWAISHGAVEGNPMAVWLIETKIAIPVKVSIGIFAVWVATAHRATTTVMTLCAAWAVVGVYMLVAALNTATLIHYIGA